MEKDTILKEQFRLKGITVFEDFYEYAYNWLKDEDYLITEKKYEEKAQPGEAKEIRITWEAYKKITDYFRIDLEIKWQVLNMREIEVEIDGRKKKMQKFSELKMDVKGILEKDYSSKWGPSGFNKFLREIYNKYIIPARTEEIEHKVREIVQNFKDEMKAYLEISGRRTSI